MFSSNAICFVMQCGSIFVLCGLNHSVGVVNSDE